jgi:hypothetical protein
MAQELGFAFHEHGSLVVVPCLAWQSPYRRLADVGKPAGERLLAHLLRIGWLESRQSRAKRRTPCPHGWDA